MSKQQQLSSPELELKLTSLFQPVYIELPLPGTNSSKAVLLSEREQWEEKAFVNFSNAYACTFETFKTLESKVQLSLSPECNDPDMNCQTSNTQNVKMDGMKEGKERSVTEPKACTTEEKGDHSGGESEDEWNESEGEYHYSADDEEPENEQNDQLAPTRKSISPAGETVKPTRLPRQSVFGDLMTAEEFKTVVMHYKKCRWSSDSSCNSDSTDSEWESDETNNSKKCAARKPTNTCASDQQANPSSGKQIISSPKPSSSSKQHNGLSSSNSFKDTGMMQCFSQPIFTVCSVEFRDKPLEIGEEIDPEELLPRLNSRKSAILQQRDYSEWMARSDSEESLVPVDEDEETAQDPRPSPIFTVSSEMTVSSSPTTKQKVIMSPAAKKQVWNGAEFKAKQIQTIEGPSKAIYNGHGPSYTAKEFRNLAMLYSKCKWPDYSSNESTGLDSDEWDVASNGSV